MKPGKAVGRDELAAMVQQVLPIFQEVNKVQTATKAQLFELIKLFRQHPKNFQEAWELAYLKIFKIFHERANRKMPPKYEQLAISFFTELLPPPSHSDPPASAFYDFFLEFLAEAVFSSLTGIRITAARMLFHLLKSHGKAGEKAQEKILKSVFYLVRLKVSTYKQIGIKLASIVLGWEGVLKTKLEDELFKIMALDQNEQIRRMAVTNLWINRNNLDRTLIRLRDKCADIRNIVLRKLVGEKYPLEQTTLSHRYKLLYDGYGNKESSVQQDTVKFFLKFFEKSDPKESFAVFVNIFEPNTLLAYPHLYTLFDLLICDIVEELPNSQITDFMRKFTNEIKSISKGGAATRPLHELIWLKNVGRSDDSELRTMFEESVPAGTELAKLLNELAHRQDVFAIYECLQLFSLQKSADELGRNRMFDALKKMVINLDFWEVARVESQQQKDDLCPLMSADTLRQKKLLLSYFDLPPISNSFDLLFETGRAMKALWPDHYEIELKQLMADWNNPEENSLLKERELAQANIKKTEGHSDSRLMGALQGKLAMINEQLERQNAKTLVGIQLIMRLRPNASMEDYMSIIKQELAKQDQAQGLILLGYYCLEEQERAENFLPLYWSQLVNPEASKLSLLITLKVTSDFFVKFNFSLFKPNDSDSDEQIFDYSVYLAKIKQLVLSSDPEIRILAIEGLCRLLFHNRVLQQLVGSCFMRLLLLWWQTSSEEASARSVHTISIFVKQFIERGQREVKKLAECLCLFFRVVLLEQSSKRWINKKKVVYNLKMEEFIKRAVVIAMTVLKYQKESRQIIWRYQESGAELGPQELFLLFLFSHKKMHFCLEKAVNICDFYEEAPLQTLILVKRQVEILLEQGSFVNAKKLQLVIKKLQSDLQERIQIKNQQTFNQQLLSGLKQQLQEYALLIDSAAASLGKELEKEEIFIENNHAIDERSEMDEEMEALQEEEVDQSLADMEEIQVLNEESKDVKKQNKQRRNMQMNSEKIEAHDEGGYEVKEQEESRTITGQLSRKKRSINLPKQESRPGRKRLPEPQEDDESLSSESLKVKKVAGRTRS